MNKPELIDAIADRGNLNKADAARALEGLIKMMETILKPGDSIVLAGIGHFEVKTQVECTKSFAKNDADPETVVIAKKNRVAKPVKS